MKAIIIEPLGVSEEILMNLINDTFKYDIEFTYYDTRTTDECELIKRGKDADIILVSNLSLSENVLSNCKNLKMISVAFTGVDHIAMNYCKNNDILVSNSSGYSNIAVSELVFGLALTVFRNIITCDKTTRVGGTKAGLIGYELFGKKFGVIGTGAIGTRTLELAKAFGCEVYAYSRTKKDIDGVTFVSMEELLETCDIVSLHVPLNESTTHLINKNNINLMKKNAILINTARGKVVESEALADALNNDVIAGAAVDVYEIEPPIATDHPLLQAKNLVATPHIAFATHEALYKRAIIVMDNIVRWVEGTPINVV